MKIEERELVGVIGLTRSKLRKEREKYVEGDDWVMEGATVMWTEGGVEKLKCAFQVEELPVTEERVDPEVREGVVVRRTLNRHVLVVRVGGEDVACRVRAQTEEVYRHYVVGMKVLVRRNEDGVWEQEGRAPRYVGRW